MLEGVGGKMNCEEKKSGFEIELEAILNMMDGGWTFAEAVEFLRRVKEISPSLGGSIVANMSKEKRDTIKEELKKKIRGETK